MISCTVLLPLVRKDHPAAIDETGNTGLYELVTQIFRAKHVVPTIRCWPNIALGLPLRKRDWVVHLNLHSIVSKIEHKSTLATIGMTEIANKNSPT